jgi:hypothetical protein
MKLPFTGNQYVETYRHIRIHHIDGEGFHASHGVSVHFGYTDTVEEIRDEIDGYWAGDEHGPLNGIFQ